MSLGRPFLRTVRQLSDGSYQNSGNGRYVRHPVYARDADKYIRAYLLIQKDMINIFDYVSPSDINLATYSFRMHEIIVRSCIEIEANFKAILRDNNYRKTSNFNMFDYFKVEATHHLSQYRIKVPYWDGEQSMRQPFLRFSNTPVGESPSPDWYKAYNDTKHDRHENFAKANLEVMIDCVSALSVLLASQFINEEYGPGEDFLAAEYGDGDGSESAIGGYFRIFFPNDWPDSDRYAFEWRKLEGEKDPFVRHNYV